MLQKEEEPQAVSQHILAIGKPKAGPQDILVVDDEDQVCDLLAEALTYMGHKVITARDGLEAVDRLNETSFSIVITDMDMPRMDGMELMKYLMNNCNGTDIIAITGHTMKYKYTDVIAAGAADFITKPFSLNELEAKLTRLIRERYLRTELEKLAIQDPLTGLFNRRFFQSVVRKEAIRCVRYMHPLFLFYFDLDHFKDYNDQNGHQAGDALLVQFSEILKQSTRKEVDTAFRLGGDEFTVVLPHLPNEQAIMVAERIRQNFNGLGLEPTTLSIGLARFLRKSGDLEKDVENMIHRSDCALYHAKHDLGGNKVFLDLESVIE